MDAVKTYEHLASCLDEIRDTDAHEVVNLSARECWWQGDLGVQFLGTKKPGSIARSVKPESQLAPGNTSGSRHVLANIDQCVMYTLNPQHPLVGAIIEAPQGVEVTHPEHGDISLREPGWYAVRYQRQYAEELRRAQD